MSLQIRDWSQISDWRRQADKGTGKVPEMANFGYFRLSRSQRKALN